METSKPIFWHQGLFLQPQHFQQADLYHQSLFRPYQRYLKPHFWGVCHLQLQTSSLEHRLCEIDAGEFLFPDGTWAELGRNACIMPRSFDTAWEETEKPFTIYLAVKKLSQHEDNVTLIPDMSKLETVRTRYVSTIDTNDVRDVYQGGKLAPLKSLTLVLRIVWETEKDDLGDYSLIPIAQIYNEGDGISYSQAFVPPLVVLSGSAALTRQIKDLRDEITGRAIQLGSYSASGQGSNKFDATLLRYQLALRTLNRFIPRLFHYTEQGEVHPWDIYATLRELIGEMSTFAEGINMLAETLEGEKLLPAYDHQNIGACFQAAYELINRLLGEITIGPQYMVEMPFDGQCFSADIPSDFFQQRVDFYLVITTQSNLQQAQHSLINMAKLASREKVQILADRSLPGIGMITVPVPPTELPRRPNTFYIKLDVHDEEWLSVERQRDIGLLWAEAPENVKVELVIVRK